jgi:multiple sugar transport system substrate-binding protein
MRGGPGGLNGWVMFGASMAGSNKFFNDDGTSTMNSEGWAKGHRMDGRSLQEGLAPKDSVNWGFNETSPASIPAPAPCSTRIRTR